MIEKFTAASCFMLCEESHNSMYNQPLDNEVVAVVDTLCRRNYDCGVLANLRGGRQSIDNLNTFTYLVKTILEINEMR